MNQQARNREIEERMLGVLSICQAISTTNKGIKNTKNTRKIRNDSKKSLFNLIEYLEVKTDELKDYLSSNKETNEEINFV